MYGVEATALKTRDGDIGWPTPMQLACIITLCHVSSLSLKSPPGLIEWMYVHI